MYPDLVPYQNEKDKIKNLLHFLGPNKKKVNFLESESEFEFSLEPDIKNIKDGSESI